MSRNKSPNGNNHQGSSSVLDIEAPRFSSDLGLDLMIKGYRNGGKNTDKDAQRKLRKALNKERIEE